jgi:hypothetical protein
LVGMTCLEAKTIILEKYPKMKLVCKKENAAHMPFKSDRHRYVIYTDQGGSVTNVVFNGETE